MKKRLDILLTERGLAVSREKAKAVIMSGIVFVDGVREDKAGSAFEETAAIELRGSTLRYVSRGGLKLEKAVEAFALDLKDKCCLFADRGDLVPMHAAEVIGLPVKDHRPGIRPLQEVDAAEQRCLAAPARPQDRDDFALVHGEVYTAQHSILPE